MVPHMKQGFSFLGFDFYWKKDRWGTPRVMCRTSRKKLQGACRRVKEWIRQNRHLPGSEFFKGLNSRLRGHYNYYVTIQRKYFKTYLTGDAGQRGVRISLSYIWPVGVVSTAYMRREHKHGWAGCWQEKFVPLSCLVAPIKRMKKPVI